MVFEDPPKKQALLSLKKSRCAFTQWSGRESEGQIRACLEQIPSNKRLCWVRSDWHIYAPLLWTLAEDKEIFLIGIESPKAAKRRLFWQELSQLAFFDIWVLDQLSISQAEALFLRALLQQHPIEVVFIQSASISFCQKKFEVRHSHHQLRVEQKKGSAPNIRYRDNPYLQFSRENFYVRSQ